MGLIKSSLSWIKGEDRNFYACERVLRYALEHYGDVSQVCCIEFALNRWNVLRPHFSLQHMSDSFLRSHKHPHQLITNYKLDQFNWKIQIVGFFYNFQHLNASSFIPHINWVSNHSSIVTIQKPSLLFKCSKVIQFGVIRLILSLLGVSS